MIVFIFVRFSNDIHDYLKIMKLSFNKLAFVSKSFETSINIIFNFGLNYVGNDAQYKKRRRKIVATFAATLCTSQRKRKALLRKKSSTTFSGCVTR